MSGAKYISRRREYPLTHALPTFLFHIRDRVVRPDDYARQMREEYPGDVSRLTRSKGLELLSSEEIFPDIKHRPRDHFSEVKLFNKN